MRLALGRLPGGLWLHLTLAAIGTIISLGPATSVDAQLPVSVPVDRGIHISSLPANRVPRPSRRTGTYTVKILFRTAVTRRAGGGAVTWLARPTTKWSGDGQRLMVLGSRVVRGELWLKVRLPIRPNGSTGWIRRDRVQLARSNRFIEIDRSQRVLRVFRRGRVNSRFRVVVGAPATPTPLGLFAIQDRVRQSDPGGFIGPWAAPLTAHSNALRHYDGGPGLVALHGRAGASLNDPLGSARSHGCVRMDNKRIAALVAGQLGTAVLIRR